MSIVLITAESSFDFGQLYLKCDFSITCFSVLEGRCPILWDRKEPAVVLLKIGAPQNQITF